MGSLRLAWLSFIRRRFGILLIVVPIMVLFSLLTLLCEVEHGLGALQVDEQDRRVIRVGAPEAKEYYFTRAETEQIGHLPHVVSHGVQTFAPYHSDPKASEKSRSMLPTSANYLRIWRNQITMTEDGYARWEHDKNGVILSKDTAKELGWTEGQHVTMPSLQPGAPPAQCVVSYIGEPGIGGFPVIYSHPEFIDELMGTPLTYWVVWVQVDEAANRDTVMDEVRNAFPGRPIRLWRMEDTKSLIGGGSRLIITVLRGAGALALVLFVTIALTLITLSLEERRREFATVRAIGAERGFVFRVIVWEALLLLGSGIVLGSAAVLIALPGGIRPVSFYVPVTWGPAAVAAAAGLVATVAITWIPARRTAALDPLTALRDD